MLRPGGLLVASMLSTRNAQYARGREVAPDTFVVDGDPGDKGHPHLYCNTRTLLALVSAFDILDLRDREQVWRAPLGVHAGAPPGELARGGNATKREKRVYASERANNRRIQVRVVDERFAPLLGGFQPVRRLR